MLQLKNIQAGYGRADCLFDVSLEVAEGEIVALLGANGAGKSTLLKAVCGMVRPRAGSIVFRGEPIQSYAAHAVVRLGISHVPEGRRILPRLSVLENLQLGAYTRRDSVIAQDLEEVFALFPVLGSRRRQLAGMLSGGEQQMLAIGRSLMAKPRLLLLDEPSLGLAPKLVAAIFGIIKRINGQGMTVLLVEQNAYQALQVAHRGYVMEAGRIVLSDKASRLAENPRVKAAYLGG